MGGRAMDRGDSPGISTVNAGVSEQTFFSPRNLPQKRYNSMESVPKTRFRLRK
jgi:hypothetical protein